MFGNIPGSIQFEPDDTKSLISAIEEFIDSVDGHESMIENAFRYVDENRNYHTMTRAVAREIVILELESMEKKHYELTDLIDTISLINHPDDNEDSYGCLRLSLER